MAKAAVAFRPGVPSTSQHVAWPDDFGQCYTVFVDTEEEFDWTAPFDRSRRSVTAAAAIPQAARRFADLGTALTFLVDHPIATDPLSIDAVAAAVAESGASVGAQLHPWVNPPHEESVSGRNSFVGNLPHTLQVAKLGALGDAITAAFGRAARSFRAGRYGLGPGSLALLAQAGYRIDSSVRARYCYAADGGPDYAAIGNAPYRTGHGDLVEIPFTTVFTGALRRVGGKLYPLAARVPRGVGVLARTALLNRVSLTPEAMPLDEAREAVAVAVGEGTALLNFAFHSPTLVPGHTPYTPDVAALRDFWRWWDVILDDLARRGVRAIGEHALIAALDRSSPAVSDAHVRVTVAPGTTLR